MTRVILVRHGEEPTNEKFEKIESNIGLTLQGVLRSYLMPQLIQQLIGDDDYEVHTYTHSLNNIPTCRSYYTVESLKGTRKFYDKSDQIDDLVKGIKKSKSKNIIVCWEHKEFEKIIKMLTDKKVNYNDVVKDLRKANKDCNKTFTVSMTEIQNLTRCSSEFSNQNEICKFDMNDDDLKYAPVWDINLDKKSLHVFADYTTQLNDTKDIWTVLDMTEQVIKY